MADATIDIPGIGETKKTYVYVAGAAAAGILAYAWYAHSKGSAADLADPGYIPGLDENSHGTTTSGLGTSTPAASDETPDPDQLPPTTNIEWSQRVVTLLSEKLGYDAQFVGATIGKYLARQGLNPTEQDLIRTAWGQLGRPPQGDFPLLSVPNQPTPPTDNPPPAGGGGDGGHHWAAFDLSVSRGQSVSSFTDAIRARAGVDVDWGLLERANGSLAGNVDWGPSGSKDLSIRKFKNAATYHIPAG